jgi:Bacterial EndoU nuclease
MKNRFSLLSIVYALLSVVALEAMIDPYKTPPMTPCSSPPLSSSESDQEDFSFINSSFESDFTTPEASPNSNVFHEALNFDQLLSSPYTKMSFQVRDTVSTPTPELFTDHEDTEVSQILSEFITTNLPTKEANFTRFFKQLSTYLPQFSIKNRQKILQEFNQSLNEFINSAELSIKEDGTISRLIGILWGFNIVLPNNQRISFEQLPKPEFIEIEHLTNPIVLKGGKATGYHLKNPKITQYPLKKIFSGSQGVYAALWGEGVGNKQYLSPSCDSACSLKCSTFFPDTWEASDIRSAIDTILQNPLYIAVTTNELVDTSTLIELDSLLDDSPKVVTTIRLLGYGKDHVLTEVIFDTKTGYIITAYPILSLHNVSQEDSAGYKIGNISYTQKELLAAIQEAKNDIFFEPRYKDKDYLIVDIAQSSLIASKQSSVANIKDFRGIYIKVPLDLLSVATMQTGTDDFE